MPNIAHEGWKGAGTGAMSGAAMGTAINPGIGTAIGAGIGAIAGFLGSRSKAKDLYEQQKQTDAAMEGISGFDPRLTSFEKELRREKRMVETGMTPEFQVAKSMIEKAGAGAMTVASRFNNPAMAISFMNQIQTGIGTNINKLVGTVGAQRGQYLAAIGEITQKLSQRELDVDVWKATQKRATFTQNLSDYNLNTNMARMHAMSELPGAIEQISGLFGGGGSLPNLPGTGGSYLPGAGPQAGTPLKGRPATSIALPTINPLPPLKTFN